MRRPSTLAPCLAPHSRLARKIDLVFAVLFGIAFGLSAACIQEYSLADVDETGPEMCAEGLTVCEGDCVNLSTDLRFCGNCDIECGEDEVCEAGTCVSACSPGCEEDLEFCVSGLCECRHGFERCAEACVNPDSDWDHCGECGQACADGLFCNAGECAATCEDLLRCGDDCVEPDHDPLNCGGCGERCAVDQICHFGVCSDAHETEVDCASCPCDGACPFADLPQCCISEFLDVPVCVAEGAC